ncbi:MAG: NADH-quinone oxidoreductase subunit L [Candidatus Eisenbacteria bacterium]|nr:NADH-quinone oxidoreductase subunit L [Candidatus Eisenbacteria bacterium]
MLDYVWLVPAFPLAGVLANVFLGGRLGKKFVGLVSCASVALAFASSVAVLVEMLALEPGLRHVERHVFTWFLSADLKVDAALLADPLSVLMMVVVSGVAFLIHVYSVGYMAGDPGYRRYFIYLNLFTFSMLTLVSGANFLVLYVGWEAVGLCSYLLIGFWYEKKAAADAGRKAFIVNRIGDFGFVLGIILIFRMFGTLDFGSVFPRAAEMFPMGSPTITAITLLLFLGATGKSAQIPLYTWLPDAMEGPTPVSALIHAATMVTAGVYMVARCSALYVLAPVSMGVVAAVGLATAVYAASIGLVQNDFKRVLAYSTISQLGYMFLACGVGAFAAGVFHLMTHAFFKALLFLVAGAVIHALAGEQDIRRMGGLRRELPVSFWSFVVASLAIAGIFPFSGFFSKDEILWDTLQARGPLVWGVAAVGVLLTAFYMFRLLFLVFWGKPRHGGHVHRPPLSIDVPLACLAVLSAVGGLVGAPMLFGRHFIKEFLAPVFAGGAGHAASAGHAAAAAAHVSAGAGAAHPVSELGMALVSISIAAVGIALAHRFYVMSPDVPRRLKEKFATAYSVLLNKYYVDEAYGAIFVRPLVAFAAGLWRYLDALVIDGAVNGSANTVAAGSRVLRRLQTGRLQDYALSVALGAVVVLLFWLTRW